MAHVVERLAAVLLDREESGASVLRVLRSGALRRGRLVPRDVVQQPSELSGDVQPVTADLERGPLVPQVRRSSVRARNSAPAWPGCG